MSSSAGGTSGRSARIDGADVVRRAIAVAIVGVATERRTAAQHLEEQEAERVHVGARVGRAPVDLLRREVARGAHHRAGAGEVVGLPTALAMPKSVTFTGPAGGHEHVRRFHVAVDEPGAVRGLERVGDLDADADHVADGERPPFRRGAAARSGR